jgi:hypothetical protein
VKFAVNLVHATTVAHVQLCVVGCRVAASDTVVDLMSASETA